MHTRSVGFTLIELILTLAILAILLGVGIPALSATLERHRLSAATEAVYAQLQYARSEVSTRNSDIYAAFQTGANWCIGLDDTASCNCNTSNDCHIGDITHSLGSADYTGIILTTNFSGDDTGFERPRLTAMENGTITLTSTSSSYVTKIVLSNLGRATLCSDDLTGYRACP